MQTENTNTDLQSIQAQLVAISAQLADLSKQQRMVREIVDEFSPITRQMMGVAIDQLAELERRGYFMFVREMASIVDRIVSHYTEDDLRQLGENVVRMVDTVKNVTQPDILAIANEATNAVHDADEAEPTGLFGMLRASNDAEVRKGLAVALQVLRHVGRAAAKVGTAEPQRPVSERQRKLAAALGPRLARPALPAPTQAPAPARAPAAAAAPRAVAASVSASCPAPQKLPAGVAPAVRIDGFALTDEGFLADANTWVPAFAEQMAAGLGVSLTERHWELIRFARADFATTGVAPNIRRITKSSDITTKELYGMFPTAPAIYAARIAGLPKPAGCI